MEEDLSRPGRLSVRTPMEWDRVAAQRRDHESLLMSMERLIRRRRECSELGWGELTILDPGDGAVFAHRVEWQDSAIVAVHSLVEEPRTVRIESDGPLVDLFADDELKPSRGRVEVPLGRYGARWFRVRRRGVPLPP